MKQFIVDSGALLAMVDRRDRYHQQAAEFVSEQPDALFYLPELIFAETMTLVKVRLGANAAVELGSRIQESDMFKVVELDQSVRDGTWEIFSRFSDKGWSYADCAILAVARQMGVSAIFSFDHHISQMAELTRLPA